MKKSELEGFVMHPLVQDYLSKKVNEKNELALKKKNELLLELNLFEKEYSDKNKYSSDYPFSEYDNQTGTSKYYKKIPIQVSDDEYSEILKYQKQETKPTNTISTVFEVLAWIVFIGGFIAGIALGNVEVEGYYSSHSEFSFAIALTYWAVSFVSGMFFLGFAEIIQLLTDIKNK